MHPLEEIPNAIKYLFDDWGQSAEPLQLEYEGHDDYTYTIDIKFDSEADWRLARANGVVPYYFVIEP